MNKKEEQEKALLRHTKRMAALRAAKTGTMNNSKWAKIFRLINDHIGGGDTLAKMLGGENLYPMPPETYSEDLRGYSADGPAGPLKLDEIEYLAVPLPAHTDLHALSAAINRLGRYDFTLEEGRLTIYGYR
ncbi:MAG: toxin-antitoxin system protein [Neisseria sp.]|nr:toxin-antitoxin system protein [Neisseria sp.]